MLGIRRHHLLLGALLAIGLFQIGLGLSRLYPGLLAGTPEFRTEATVVHSKTRETPRSDGSTESATRVFLSYRDRDGRELVSFVPILGRDLPQFPYGRTLEVFVSNERPDLVRIDQPAVRASMWMTAFGGFLTIAVGLLLVRSQFGPRAPRLP